MSRRSDRPIAARNARGAIAAARYRGLLPHDPPFCQVCGVAGYRRRPAKGGPAIWTIHLHHHSYEPAFWLDVVAVCSKCHAGIHLGRIPEPLTGELRTGERVRTTKRKVVVP